MTTRYRMARANISALMLYSTSLITTALLSKVPSLTAKPGDNIMLPCSYILDGRGGFLSWFRHGPNDSVPLCILSVFNDKDSQVKYHNRFSKDHIKLHHPKSTCEIRNVDLSDSGLYFCGRMLESAFTFDSATLVKVEGPMAPKASDVGDCKRSTWSGHIPVVCTLGGVIVILIVILILTCKVTRKGEKPQHHADEKQDQDSETLNYAALNFTQNKKKARRREEIDPHVVYAATR